MAQLFFMFMKGKSIYYLNFIITNTRENKAYKIYEIWFNILKKILKIV